jgi:cell division septum initiation protein DivIVA
LHDTEADVTACPLIDYENSELASTLAELGPINNHTSTPDDTGEIVITSLILDSPNSKFPPLAGERAFISNSISTPITANVDLEAQLRELKEHCEKHKRDLKSTRNEVTTARYEMTKLKIAHAEELKKLQEKIATQQDSGLEGFHDGPAADRETLVATNRKLVKENLKLQERLKKLRDSKDMLKTSHCAIVAELGLNHAAALDELRKKVDDLVKDQKCKAPLVSVGEAVRLRFLEYAREGPPREAGYQANVWIKSQGDAAAHRGDMEADAALFKLEHPSSHGEITVELFEKIYRTPKEDCVSFPASLRWALNAMATIRVLKPARGVKRSTGLRTKHNELAERIIALWNEDPTAQNFGETPAVSECLLQLHGLTDEIVSAERPRNQGRGIVSYLFLLLASQDFTYR